MSVKIVVGKCEKCGADIRFDEDQERGYCEYCGTEFIISNDNNSFAHEAFSYLNKAGKRLQENKISAEVQEKNRKNGILYLALMFGVCMLFIILVIVLKMMGIE